MCPSDAPQILYLRSDPAGGNLGGGVHEFRDIDTSHWPNASQWRVRCIGWTMFNLALAPVAVAGLALHLDGFTSRANATRSPLAIGCRDVHNVYQQVGIGPEIVGALAGGVLRFRVTNARTGAAETTDTWVAVLECRPAN